MLLGQALDHGKILERGNIAGNDALLRDLAEQAAHDLAAAGLRQAFRETNVRGAREGADIGGDVIAENVAQIGGRGLPGPERDEATMASPLISSGRATTAASATAGWLTSALSISIVLKRWPATLMTSSTRPSTQR